MISSRWVLLRRCLCGTQVPLAVHPTFGGEGVWVGMAVRVKVHGVVVRKDGCAGGDEVSFVDIVFGGCVGETAGGDWTEALGFFDYGADVREIRFVGELGETMGPDYRVKFFLCFCDDVGEGNGR